MADATLTEALAAVGRGPAELARRPVLRGAGGTVVSVGRPGPEGHTAYSVVWVAGTAVRFAGEAPAATGAGTARGLAGPSAELFDRLGDAVRLYLERVEEVDAHLSEIERRGRAVALAEIWRLQRRTAALRAQIGRTFVAVAELAGPLASAFPGLAAAAPSVEAELGRVQQLCASVQQSLSDLILLRNAEESNRIAEAANDLARTSNRIAALANTSNLRMLGLTYIALVLGLLSAALLFPNTAGTILGMPSAAWIPGPWVDVVVLLAIVLPILLILWPKWVRTLLAELPLFTARAAEGLRDLPEVPAPADDGAPEASQRL